MYVYTYSLKTGYEVSFCCDYYTHYVTISVGSFVKIRGTVENTLLLWSGILNLH